jgi:UDP-N-acetyl-D-mannosaminuronate dehydrogenase
LTKGTKMKIGIVGLGFVGGTHMRAFKEAGMSEDAVGHDVKLGSTSIRDVLACSVVFLCLPSPTIASQQDLSILHSVCRELSDLGFAGVAVIKSTVLPGTTKMLAEKFGLRLVHSPEFLREQTAFEDFKNQKIALLSGNARDCDEVSRVYLKAFDGLWRDVKFLTRLSPSPQSITTTLFLPVRLHSQIRCTLLVKK